MLVRGAFARATLQAARRDLNRLPEIQKIHHG
jgi:hypothetical protein